MWVGSREGLIIMAVAAVSAVVFLATVWSLVERYG